MSEILSFGWAHKKRAAGAAREVGGDVSSVFVPGLDTCQEVVNGVQKVALAGGHGEVDGIEVGLAVETAQQILLRVEVRSAFAAVRADEDQLAVAAWVFRWYSS